MARTGGAPSTRPTLADALLGAGVTAGVSVAVAADLASGAPGTEDPGLVSYGFAVVLGLVLLGRRRWPVGTLAVTLALVIVYSRQSHPPVGVAIPSAGALFSAAERGRARWATALGGAFLAVTTTARALEGDERLDLLLGYELVTAVALAVAVIALGDATWSRRGWQVESARRERAVEAAQERRTAQRVAEERTAVAREVHDVLAHTLSVISIHADVGAEALDDDPETARSTLRTIRATASEALAELRGALRLLRAGAAAPRLPVGGLDQLDRIVDSAAESGLAVRLAVHGDPVPLPAVVDAAAHRILQESVTNVLRHAKARSLGISLRYVTDALEVRVEDDGCGADGVTPGLGLTGMQERVAVLGGRISAGRSHEGGFVVEARLPLPEPQ